jgi:diguanylate cyclase (GGDEF)-like protein/PAS domain S-box-containing protein
MKKLLRKQLERATQDAKNKKSVLSRLLPLVLRQYQQFWTRIDKQNIELEKLRGQLQEYSTDDRSRRDQRLRAVLDNVKDGILSVDEDGTILSINRTGERIFGYKAGQLENKPLSLLLAFPDNQDAAAYLSELSRARDCTVLEMSPYQTEAQHRKGNIFPVDIVVSHAIVDEREIYIVGVRDMTERVQAERALRESEARYRSLVDSAPEAVVVFDTDLDRFIDVNDSALKMFAADRETLLSWSLKNISPARQPDGSSSSRAARRFIQAAMEGKTPVFQWSHQDSAGQEIPCEVRLTRLESGERRLVRGSITDITERKRAEVLAAGEKSVLEQVASNGLLSDVLDSITHTVGEVTGNANCAILLLDHDGEHLVVGSAPGLPDELVAALGPIPVASLTDRPATDKTLAETVITADMGSDPIWTRHRELAERHGLVSCWSTAIRSSEGNILGAFAAFYEIKPAPVIQSFELFDRMTRLTGIAIERNVTEKAVRKSESRFRGLFENVLDGVYQISSDGCFISANPAMVKMLGYDSEEDLKAVGPTQNLYANPREREGIIAELYDKGQIRNAELSLLRKDGSEIVVLENSRVVRDESESVVAYEGTLSDITERKRAETEVFEQKERAQVTLKSIADAVITTDADGRIDYMNPVAEELTGRQRSEVSGKPISNVLSIIDENTRESLGNPVDICLGNGQATDPGQHSILINTDECEIAIQDSAAPIRDKHGRIIGAVMVFHDMGKERHLRHQLAYQATHDPLTGLINRREFEVRLEEALEEVREDPSCTHVLLYLDLDQFKVVNDTCGHSAGDQLLQQLTSLIGRRVRSSDIVSRLGGDEFGILLEDCSIERAVEVADGLRQAIRRFRFFWKDAAFDVGVSIGLVGMNEDSESVASLLSEADVACYAAKDEGRNRLHVYQQGDATERHAEMQWIARVTRALEDDRLELFYQPIVPINGDGTRRAHYELLLRMNDESGNKIAPNAFIPAAERYNLMPTLDRWVVKYAIENLADKGDGERDDRYTLAVNLSGTSLNDDTFLDFILALLKTHDLATGAICFEITETAAISNLSRVAHFMTEVKKHGCEFSLDDFGSGLSSFTYLKNLPVDYLKIDGHFIHNIAHDRIDQAMVKAITDVGNALGIRVVAEHVETREVLETLASIGVEFAQGYFFAEPAPVSGFARFESDKKIADRQRA